MAKCKGCGATIIWINTPADRHIPCDEGIVPYWKDSKGDQKIVTQDGEVVTCWLDGDPAEITGCGRIPHWATCPNANSFRKKRGK